MSNYKYGQEGSQDDLNWEITQPDQSRIETSDLVVEANLSNQTITTLTLEQLTESFAANVSYFYLRDDIGLSDEALWRVTYEASSVLGIKASVVREKVRVLQEMMNLTKTDVRDLITLYPSILTLSAQRNLAPTMLFLIRSLDLGKEDLRNLVLRCPAVLSYARSNLRAKLTFFFQLMEYTVEETRELLLKEPKLMRSSVQGNLVPHLRFFLGKVGLSQRELRPIIQKNPKLLLYSIHRNLLPKLNILNMTTTQTHKLLAAFPQVFDYNLSRTISPIIRYLRDELGFGPEETAKIIARYPRIFSISHSLKTKVGFFRYELGLSHTTIKTMIIRSPDLLSISTDTVRSKMDFLMKHLDMKQDEILHVFGLMPSLFNLNLDRNIGPKIEYLSKCNVDLRRAVLKLPALLAYSLEGRIVPRVEAMKERGLNVDDHLASTIQRSDEYFYKWVKKQKNLRLSNDPKIDNPPRSAADRITHWTRS